VSAAASSGTRTAAAIAARRIRSQAASRRVQDTLTAPRRENARVTVAAVARSANVSRTFIYDNPQARAAVADALANLDQRRTLTKAYTEISDTQCPGVLTAGPHSVGLATSRRYGESVT